jgi:hypothetical protein
LALGGGGACAILTVSPIKIEHRAKKGVEMANSFRGLLEVWVGQEVTVVNPESYKSTQLGKGLTFQTYPAKVDELGEDYVKLAYSSVKGESQTAVEQIIPIGKIKRISMWGEERIVHI